MAVEERQVVQPLPGPSPRHGVATDRHPSQARPWLRRIGFLVAAMLMALSAATGWSIGTATAVPSGDGVTVQLAEWARDHGLGAVVTAMEALQYRLHPPVTGGTPDTSLLTEAARTAARTAHAAVAPTTGPVVPRLPRVTSQVTPALDGEGVFVPASAPGHGAYVQVAYVRPDPVHTSYLTGVVWMSHLDRFTLHPGFQDPGPVATWTQSSHVPPSAFPTLLATFNSGFKMKDSNGGYYDHGQTAGTLTSGAASLVIYRDGHATVGTWGSDVRMTPEVAFVRQNLQPLVLGGRLVPNLDTNVESTWGATLGGAYAVWRSGIGVTRNGDLVYAMGDALSVQALASILKGAGAVTAMQLDINRAWTSYMTYTQTATGVTAHKVGTFERPANRYLSPTSRDFISVATPA